MYYIISFRRENYVRQESYKMKQPSLIVKTPDTTTEMFSFETFGLIHFLSCAYPTSYHKRVVNNLFIISNF